MTDKHIIDRTVMGQFGGELILDMLKEQAPKLTELQPLQQHALDRMFHILCLVSDLGSERDESCGCHRQDGAQEEGDVSGYPFQSDFVGINFVPPPVEMKSRDNQRTGRGKGMPSEWPPTSQISWKSAELLCH